MEVVEEKIALRRKFLTLRAAISPMERLVVNGAIAGAVLSLHEVLNAPGIVGYASDGTEPELRGILEAVLENGKKVALPRFVKEKNAYELAEVNDYEHDLIPGKYNLLEPRPELASIRTAGDWGWLIPGVAFDAHGTRLGRGKGFYDRLLAVHPGIRIGVFYQCQFSERALPHAAHDCQLKLAVTEKNIYRF